MGYSFNGREEKEGGCDTVMVFLVLWLVGWLVGEGETVKTLPLEFNSQYLENFIRAFFFSFLRESLIKG